MTMPQSWLPWLQPPKVERLESGIFVVRDDLVPGGTKARYLYHAFAGAEEVVYASPAQGGAQLALAYVARALGKRATIFVAGRKDEHPRTREARAVGARIMAVRPGYLAVVQARASEYAEAAPGRQLLPFGGDLPEAEQEIARVAGLVWLEYGPFDEVWCAAGSGVLVRGLQKGMPGEGEPLEPEFYAVQVGRDIENIGRAELVRTPFKFDEACGTVCPFPSCPNYDRKAWGEMMEWSTRRGRWSGGRYLFWNVMGPSPTPHLAKIQRASLLAES